MRLGFRLVESLYPPNQPLNGGNPIENLTGNLKRKFQFMIVSFDTIIVNRLRVFCKSKIHAKACPATAVARESVSRNRGGTRKRVSTPTGDGAATAGKNLPPAPTPASPAPSSRNSPHP